MSRIGLIDVDSHNYPNIALAKLSAYHKAKGDSVEWYEPLFGGWYDKVYMSKVFSNAYTKPYDYAINADEVEYGGSGFCIKLVNGKEWFDVNKHNALPHEIEHQCPDLSIYSHIAKVKDNAYGFLTRGCPRSCGFCIVGKKEGTKSVKVADVSEFYRGQKNIILMDPNFMACEDRAELLEQLSDTGAYIDWNQGLDIRLIDKDIAKLIGNMKIKALHFAMDSANYEPIIEKLEQFIKHSGITPRKIVVFILTNYNTSIENDIERVDACRKLGVCPCVSIYNRPSLPRKHVLKNLQRYANLRWIYYSLNSFKEYKCN